MRHACSLRQSDCDTADLGNQLCSRQGGCHPKSTSRVLLSSGVLLSTFSWVAPECLPFSGADRWCRAGAPLFYLYPAIMGTICSFILLPNAGTAVWISFVRHVCCALRMFVVLDAVSKAVVVFEVLPHSEGLSSWLSQSRPPAMHSKRTRQEPQALWKPHADCVLTALLDSAEGQSHSAQLGSAQPGDVLSDGVVSAIETEEQEVRLHRCPELHHPPQQLLRRLSRPCRPLSVATLACHCASRLGLHCFSWCGAATSTTVCLAVTQAVLARCRR